MLSYSCPPPPAAREGRRAARVAVEALQQAGLLQPVPQHADRPGEAGPLLLLWVMPQEDARWRRQVVKEKKTAAVVFSSRLCERNLPECDDNWDSMTAKLLVEIYFMFFSAKEPVESVFISSKKEKEILPSGSSDSFSWTHFICRNLSPSSGLQYKEKCKYLTSIDNNFFVCHFQGGPVLFFSCKPVSSSFWFRL